MLHDGKRISPQTEPSCLTRSAEGHEHCENTDGPADTATALESGAVRFQTLRIHPGVTFPSASPCAVNGTQGSILHLAPKTCVKKTDLVPFPLPQLRKCLRC